jgi:hypothetical protein
MQSDCSNDVGLAGNFSGNTSTNSIFSSLPARSDRLTAFVGLFPSEPTDKRDFSRSSRRKRRFLPVKPRSSRKTMGLSTKGETERLLDHLANGDKLNVRGVNDTSECPLSPEVEVTGV